MTINIFEGARRIAKSVAVLWILGWVVAAFVVSPPYVFVTYTVSSPITPPVRSDPSCEYGDNATETVTVNTKKGTKASATLCFIARKTSDGRMLIPYRLDASTGTWWGNSRNESEVQTYTKRVRDSFVLPQADESWIDGQWWSQRVKEFGLGALGAILGLVFLWGFTWTVGWIVRGFLGIPRGQDHRPPRGAE